MHVYLGDQYLDGIMVIEVHDIVSLFYCENDEINQLVLLDKGISLAL